MLALILASLAVALGLAFALTRRGDLWKRLGVPSEPGLPIFGNYFPLIAQKASIYEVYRDIYRKNDGQPFVGIHKFGRPALLVRDVDLAVKILTTDFSSFHDNAIHINPKLDPLIALNLFFLKGEQWKKSRTQLVPAFSPARLKNLLPPTAEVTEELVAYTRTASPGALPDGLDVKELAAKFTTEVVASVALGVRANSFRDDDAEIRSIGRRIFEPTAWNNFITTIGFFWPAVQDFLGTSLMPKDVEQFFRRLVGEALKHREEKGITRNDFLQLLIGLKQKAQQEGDSYSETEMTAHAITFFSDGFETSSVALSWLLHDLSGSPEAQRRLRVDLAKLRADDHEALLKLPFLHACLMESLRLHTPLGFVERTSTASYNLQLPDGREATLPKDTHVVFPYTAWHTDPALFPDPEVFRPERFLEEAGGDANGGAPKGAFMPFGYGPRQCIGMRFAQTQVKMGAAALLRAFELKRTPRSPSDPVQQDPKTIFTAALGGLWVHFEPLVKES